MNFKRCLRRRRMLKAGLMIQTGFDNLAVGKQGLP